MKSDKDGFLILGVESASKDDISNQIASMRKDIAAIRDAVLGDAGASTAKSVDALHETVKRAAREDRHANQIAQRARVATPVQKVRVVESQTQLSNRVRRENAASAALPARGAMGRFVASGGASSNVESVSIGRSRISMDAVANAVKSGVSAASNAANSVSDPAIKAMGEVATPLKGMMSGAGDASNKTLGRIWRWLRRKDDRERVEQRKQQDTLTDISRKPFGKAGAKGSILSGLGLGAGASIFGSGASVLKGAGGAVGGLLGGLGRAAAKGGRGIGGLLKKIPILGPLLSAGMAAWDYSEATTDQERHRAIGGGIGGVGGGIIGAALGGPIGAAIGAFAGDALGKYAGEKWTEWEPTVSAAWNKVRDTATAAITGISEAAGKLWTDVKGWFGDRFAPVVDKVSEGIEVAAKAASSFQEKASAAFGNAVDYVKDMEIVKAGGRVWDKVKGMLGDTSARFESNGKAGTISTGRGDFGGRSYGAYQFSSSMGVADAYAAQSKYASEFKGLKAGTAAFDAAWARVAGRDPSGFKADQHAFVMAKYYEPMRKYFASKGIDMSKRSEGLGDAMWSTAVQFGPERAMKMFETATGGLSANLSDEQIIRAIQGYKIAKNDMLFSSSSASVRAGTLARASLEQQALLSKVNVPMAPSVSAAPTLRDQLNVNVKNSPATKDIGQDVKDRNIAHVATGGKK